MSTEVNWLAGTEQSDCLNSRRLYSGNASRQTRILCEELWKTVDTMKGMSLIVGGGSRYPQ